MLVPYHAPVGTLALAEFLSPALYFSPSCGTYAQFPLSIEPPLPLFFESRKQKIGFDLLLPSFNSITRQIDSSFVPEARLAARASRLSFLGMLLRLALLAPAAVRIVAIPTCCTRCRIPTSSISGGSAQYLRATGTLGRIYPTPLSPFPIFEAKG